MAGDPSQPDRTESAALQYALIDLLIQSGVVDREDLEKSMSKWRKEMGLSPDQDPLAILKPSQNVQVFNDLDETAQPRVLVVDDLKFIRDLIRTTLSNQDYQVVAEAKDGLEALEYFEKLRPDVVIMDIEMKGMNGLVALESMRKLSPHIPVIIMTGNPEKAYVNKAVGLGSVDFLIKPLDINRLLAVLKKVLNR